MDIKQSVLRCVRDKYADFNGRAGRPEFWWFALFVGIGHLALNAWAIVRVFPNIDS